MISQTLKKKDVGEICPWRSRRLPYPFRSALEKLVFVALAIKSVQHLEVCGALLSAKSMSWKASEGRAQTGRALCFNFYSQPAIFSA